VTSGLPDSRSVPDAYTTTSGTRWGAMHANDARTIHEASGV